VEGLNPKYRWFKNNVAIEPPINQATLYIRNVQFSDMGNYLVEITFNNGVILKSSATLKVTPIERNNKPVTSPEGDDIYLDSTGGSDEIMGTAK
jgi:hypothetical protein